MILWGQKVTSDNVGEIVREHYKNELEKGYLIETGFKNDLVIYTGKEGAISMEIALIKAIIEKYGDTE